MIFTGSKKVWYCLYGVCLDSGRLVSFLLSYFRPGSCCAVCNCMFSAVGTAGRKAGIVGKAVGIARGTS